MLVLTLLASLGLTFIVTKSWLFEKVREWPEKEWLYILLHCPQCFGFWSGVAVSIISPLNSLFYIIAIGLANSGICFLLNELMEKITPLYNKE